ncbi:MAG: serine--tRNA ligase [Candidatus Diapherotrites archaeon]
MISIHYFRENVGKIKKNLEKRNDFAKLDWVEEICDLDGKYLKALQEAENLRMKRNSLAKEIDALIVQKKDFKDKIAEAKELPQKIKEVEAKANELKEKIDYYLMRLPNVLDEGVPLGSDETENVVVKEFGEKKLNQSLLPHGELLEKNNWADFESASNVSGPGFYYLKFEFAELALALERFALDKILSKGYSLVLVPFMLKRSAYERVTDLEDFENVMYKVDQEDLYLIATSEHSMCAMYQDHIFEESDLPLKLVSVSPCFRREIGKHGVDTRGIFRVHQFNKVEQFIFCRPEQSFELHEELLANAEEIYKDLGLAYRVVNICAGDIGTVAAKKYDIEAWMPREGKYREVVSCSNCTSYQAVRSNIKFRKKLDKSKDYVHTLNSTAVAITRTLRAIVETYYDGNVLKVPSVLQKYLGGRQEISPK